MTDDKSLDDPIYTQVRQMVTEKRLTAIVMNEIKRYDGVLTDDQYKIFEHDVMERVMKAYDNCGFKDNGMPYTIIKTFREYPLKHYKRYYENEISIM